MGKTKIKVVDDSAPEAEEKKKKIKAEKSVKSEEKIENRESKIVVEDRKVEDGEEKIQEVEKQINLPTSTIKKPSSSINHPSSKKVRSKKYQEALKQVDPNQKYPLPEAVKLTQTASYSKFPGTIEAHININVKNLRGLVTLPFASGKKLKVLAFGPSTSLRINKDAPEFQGVIWGDEETISEIEKGKIDFDTVVTTPDWMPKLAKVAKVLGPKGLMPNPKNGTITENLSKAVADLQGGKTEYKTQANSQVIHLGIGKIDQPMEEISANIKALYITIGKSKISKITLSPSMGPGVKVELSSI